MAIVQEQKAQGQGASTTPSVSWPSTPTADNLLIAILFSGASTVSTPPAGYTAFPAFSPATDSHPIYYKVAAGTETSVDFVVNEASYYGMAIFEYSGLKTTGVADQNDTAESLAAESLTVTAPAENDAANSLIMVSGSTWWTDVDFTYSAGYTEEYDVVEDGWMNFCVASRIVSALETPSCEVSQNAGSTKEMSAVMAVFEGIDSVPHTESETDAVGVTDGPSRDFEAHRSTDESVGAIDATTVIKDGVRLKDENVGISDVVATQHWRRLRPIADEARGRWETDGSYTWWGDTPTLVGVGAKDESTLDCTYPLPVETVLEDDLIILQLELENTTGEEADPFNPTSAPAAPTGYTTYYSQASQAAGFSDRTRMAVYYKRATASESDVFMADVGNHQVGFLSVWRGVAWPDPFDVAADGRTSTNDSTVTTSPPVTTTGSNRRVLWLTAAGDALTVDSTYSNVGGGSGADEGPTVAKQVSTSGGTDGSTLLAHGVKTSQGLVGGLSADVYEDEEEVNLTVALKPGILPAGPGAPLWEYLSDGLEDGDTYVYPVEL